MPRSALHTQLLLLPPCHALLLDLLPLELLPARSMLPVGDSADQHGVVPADNVLVLTLESQARFALALLELILQHFLDLRIAVILHRRCCRRGGGRGRSFAAEASEERGVLHPECAASGTDRLGHTDRALGSPQAGIHGVDKRLVALVFAHYHAATVRVGIRLVDQEVEPLPSLGQQLARRQDLELDDIVLQVQALQSRGPGQGSEAPPQRLDMGAQQRLTHCAHLRTRREPS
mmetsp:Transcript_80930/g.179873  ORF Transcript_80930/g.179873 Transcript_80930/m.179873 type:complete len:233 (-) Transcript_80930:3-701(-)